MSSIFCDVSNILRCHFTTSVIIHLLSIPMPYRPKFETLNDCSSYIEYTENLFFFFFFQQKTKHFPSTTRLYRARFSLYQKIIILSRCIYIFFSFEKSTPINKSKRLEKVSEKKRENSITVHDDRKKKRADDDSEI